MSSIKQFAGQAVIYGLGSMLSKVVYYLLITVYLTYLFGEERQPEYGIFSGLYAWLTVLLVLFSFKLDTALFRYGNKQENFKQTFDTISSMVCVFALFALVLVFIFNDSIATLIGYDGQGNYVIWFGFILAFDIIALIGYARLRLENKAKQFTLFKIANVLITCLLCVFFLAVYPKYSDSLFNWIPKFEKVIDYLFLINVFVSALFLGILLYYIKGFEFRISKSLAQKILPYALPLVIVGIANNFIQYFGVNLIQFFYDGTSEENQAAGGVFEASRKIAGFFALFIGAYNFAAEPFFFNNSSHDDKEKMYGKICSLFVLAGGFFCLVLVFYMDLTKYLVDAAYRESLFIVPILLMAYLLLGIYHNFSIWYKLSDKTKYGALISLLGALITLVFSFCFLKDWGYVACAYASLLSYFVMVVLAYWLGQKHYPISYPMKKIVGSVFIIGALLAFGNYSNDQFFGTQKLWINTSALISYVLYVYYAEKNTWDSMLFKKYNHL